MQFSERAGATVEDRATSVIIADKTRAFVAVIFPFALPFGLALGLSTSGYSWTEYPSLLASGQLSWVRQGLGWIAMIALIAIHWPPAITALFAPSLVSTSEELLIGPTGDALTIATIEGIELRRGFFHRYMQIRSASGSRTIILTFARGRLADMKRQLEADPHLDRVTVS